jgi:hypothetical protein
MNSHAGPNVNGVGNRNFAREEIMIVTNRKSAAQSSKTPDRQTGSHETLIEERCAVMNSDSTER